MQAAGGAPFKPCVVVPYYNHPQTIATVLAKLQAAGVDCFLVDDGSDAVNRTLLEHLAANLRGWLRLLRHESNRGKGAAVITGCDTALTQGYTHALQIDADGQHDIGDVPRMLELARQHPQAVVQGKPVYDASIPRARRYGRHLTHVWVHINTLSLQIGDSMCGMRVYPLAAAHALWSKQRLGLRMDFDIEVIVRLVWRGVPVVNVPTHVTYPAGGVSHFDVWRDNVRISRMHARLFLGMLWRSPWLLARRLQGWLRAQSGNAA
jgi:glycosyltransferase involved in cell wall biosynthesis